MNDKRDLNEAASQTDVRLKVLTDEQSKVGALRAIDAMGARQGVQALRQTVNRVRQIEDDPFLPNLGQQLTERVNQGRTGFPIPAKYVAAGAAATFLCPDFELEQRLKRVTRAIGKVRTMPEVHFTDFTDQKTGVMAAFQRLGHTAIDAVTMRGINNDGDLRREDWPALGIALTIEALLLLSTVIKVGGAPLHLADRLREVGDGAAGRLWKMTGENNEFRSMLARRAHHVGRRVFIFIDADAPYESPDFRLRQVLELLIPDEVVNSTRTGRIAVWLAARGWRGRSAREFFHEAGAPIAFELDRRDYAQLVVDHYTAGRGVDMDDKFYSTMASAGAV